MKKLQLKLPFVDFPAREGEGDYPHSGGAGDRKDGDSVSGDRVVVTLARREILYGHVYACARVGEGGDDGTTRIIIVSIDLHRPLGTGRTCGRVAVTNNNNRFHLR